MASYRNIHAPTNVATIIEAVRNVLLSMFNPALVRTSRSHSLDGVNAPVASYASADVTPNIGEIQQGIPESILGRASGPQEN